MQRDLSPISFPNTFRDSNDMPTTTTTTRELVLPSAPHNDLIDFNSESRHSIIRPVDSDHLPSSHINSNQNRITNKPLVKSIVRQNGNDDEKLSQEQFYNESLINDNNTILEAAGYDSGRSAEIDADAAFALQLQQEEYTKESLIPFPHPYDRFEVETNDEPAAATPPLFVPFNNQHFLGGDQHLAAYLQEEENRNRQQHRQPPISFFPMRQHSNPVYTQSSETDDGETEHISPFARFNQRQPSNIEDDSDEDNSYMNIPHPFLRFFANQGQPLPENFPSIFANYRSRGYRRTGSLQDTEEDFGPEDYERLLQLDDTIHKKKLNSNQIDSIPIEKFLRTSNNTDEENKCGVCLERFEENQPLRRFPCHHVYHKECADRWLQENNVCPICREPPIKIQSTTHSRHHRGMNNMRRPTNTNRSYSNRNNNNNNNNNNNTNHHQHQHRRGPPPHRQS